MMKSFKTLAFAVFMTASGLLSACSSSENIVDNLPDDYIVNMVYPEHRVQLTSEQQAFVAGNNSFAFDFFSRINALDGAKSSFCSPLSITYMLGMLQAGATGETQKQILKVMGMGAASASAVNEYCARLTKELPALDSKVTLDIANSIYVNSLRATIRDTYAADMNRYYDAPVSNLDFTNPTSLGVINGWCNDKTQGMIPKILDEIDEKCVMYLLNAIYFKADWTEKFEEKYTRNESFTTVLGATKEQPMMHQRVRVRYGESSDYTSVSLPYGDGAFSMTIMLPKSGKNTDDVIRRLSRDFSKNGSEDYHTSICDVDVKVPRFETATEMEKLPDVLSAMGMPLAFDSEWAEFTNMVDEGTLYVDMMKQKAKIEVNEKGSKAAAVTIAGMAFTTAVGPHEEPVYEKREFHADRPFVYLITERGSNVVLFIGKYVGD